MTKMTAAARKARTARITARSAFAIGVAVSLAANVYASKHTPIGIAVGLWTPIAFLVSMALLENVPAKGLIGKLRFTAIVFLALIAGWTSLLAPGDGLRARRCGRPRLPRAAADGRRDDGPSWAGHEGEGRGSGATSDSSAEGRSGPEAPERKGHLKGNAGKLARGIPLAFCIGVY
jgi:hypothetical protein